MIQVPLREDKMDFTITNNFTIDVILWTVIIIINLAAFLCWLSLMVGLTKGGGVNGGNWGQ